MKVTRHVVIQLEKYSAEDNEERCGVIIGPPLSFIEVPNRHHEPVHNFGIWLSDVGDVMSRHPYLLLLGFFHVHPGNGLARPSTRDYHHAGLLPQYAHVMYHPFSRRLVWFDQTGIVKAEMIRYRLGRGRREHMG